MFDENLCDIDPPAQHARLTNQQILLGQPLNPLTVITTYSDSEWEMFIREWVEGLRSKYKQVRRASGAGDKGRDVIGYVEQVSTASAWDNYQCKHYDHALYPSDLWKELAKLCVYTHDGSYSTPRAYYFVAPRGVGPEALTIFEDPSRMRNGLLKRWTEGGLLSIGRADVPLSAELKAHVETFPFEIVRDIPPSQIIEQHRQTRYHATRFGGGLVRFPPTVADVPDEVSSIETHFVERLLKVYAERASVEMPDTQALNPYPKFKRHFDRQRNYFYLAELLRNFTRDNIPEDSCFERLQEIIFDGVIDTIEADHHDGYERLNQTLNIARSLQIDTHPLRECLELYHRSGICHQLANDQRFDWVSQ